MQFMKSKIDYLTQMDDSANEKQIKLDKFENSPF